MTTKHHQFNSSFLDSCTYDDKTYVLTVEFKNGKIYTYDEVSPEAYDGFVEADSPGQWYGMNIRGKFPLRVEE